MKKLFQKNQAPNQIVLTKQSFLEDWADFDIENWLWRSNCGYVYDPSLSGHCILSEKVVFEINFSKKHSWLYFTVLQKVGHANHGIG